MRILHVLNDVTDAGNGIVNAAIDMAAGQCATGHQVAIVSAGGGFMPLLADVGIKHFVVDFRRRPIAILRALVDFNTVVRTCKPDVVHAHVRTGLLFAWLFAKWYRYALIGHLHNIHEGRSDLMGMADRVIVVSDAVARTLNARGVPKRKIRTVRNGPLGSPRLKPLETLPIVALDHPAIVTVAGMNHRKGISDLIAAFSLVGETSGAPHLYLVGGGPDQAEFERQAASLPVASRIHFEGRSTNPQGYMAAADVFVLASRRDSFPLVLAEARQAGCAIIASDVDGIPEALQFGEAGLLFPPQDVGALANCLRLFINSKSEREDYALKARAGLEKFEYRHFAQGIINVYKEVTEST